MRFIIRHLSFWVTNSVSEQPFPQFFAQGLSRSAETAFRPLDIYRPLSPQLPGKGRCDCHSSGFAENPLELENTLFSRHQFRQCAASYGAQRETLMAVPKIQPEVLVPWRLTDDRQHGGHARSRA